jgi:hypothetical protein
MYNKYSRLTEIHRQHSPQLEFRRLSHFSPSLSSPSLYLCCRRFNFEPRAQERRAPAGAVPGAPPWRLAGGSSAGFPPPIDASKHPRGSKPLTRRAPALLWPPAVSPAPAGAFLYRLQKLQGPFCILGT